LINLNDDRHSSFSANSINKNAGCREESMKSNDVPRAAPGRRQFLEAAAALGAYGMLPGESLAAEVPFEFDGSRFQLTAPEPNPKRGGVLRYAITSRPPHFDVHQSGTINSLGAQGCISTI